MTMTEIEAKALALVNAHAINRRSDLDDAKHTELRCALLDAVQSQVATEARHAAELREQAERFSEVAARMVAMAEEDCSSLWAGVTRQILAPFILPAPDPLVEAIKACNMATLDGIEDAVAHDLRAAMQARGYEWRKIGEAGE